MAGQPLSPATDRRLGGPLPHQQANQTRGHLKAINLWHQNHAVSMHYAVLAIVSNRYSPLKGRFLTRYSPVRHCPRFQLDESSIHRFSFDLHVLSTPPAFVLSQDQTLRLILFSTLKVFLLATLSFSQVGFALLFPITLSWCSVHRIFSRDERERFYTHYFLMSIPFF